MKLAIRLIYLCFAFYLLQPALLMGPTRSPSTVYIGIDEELTEFKINNNPILLPPGQDYKNWSITKKFDVVLFPGDYITIVGNNVNGENKGLVVTIDYVDKKGVHQKYVSGDDWICNEGKPLIQAKNKDKSTAWNKGGKGMDHIDPEASWIWGKNNENMVTCIYRIPCKKR